MKKKSAERVSVNIPEEVKVDAPIKFSENTTIVLEQLKKDTKNRFDKIDNILLAVVASVIISGIAVTVSVAGMIIDQLRYNNAAYTEYSNRINSLQELQTTNKTLMNQLKEQQSIIESEQRQNKP